MLDGTRAPTAGPRSQEHVLRRSRARLQTGFVFPLGGELLLTERELLFVPSRASFSHPVSSEIRLGLDAIDRVAIRRGDLRDPLGLSFLTRLEVVAGDRSYLFQVRESRSWEAAIRERLRPGGPSRSH